MADPSRQTASPFTVAEHSESLFVTNPACPAFLLDLQGIFRGPQGLGPDAIVLQLAVSDRTSNWSL